jgi:hypothetical protein
MESLFDFLQDLDMDMLWGELHARGVNSVTDLQTVSTHDDLKFLCPSLQDPMQAVTFLKLFKAITSSTANNDGQRRASAGTMGSGSTPWTLLEEDYRTLKQAGFQFPLWPIQLALQLQGIVKLRRKQKFRVKNCLYLEVVQATGCVFWGESDPGLVAPTLKILFPQMGKEKQWIGWEDAMTDFMQNVRSGACRAFVPHDNEAQAFIELNQFRPPSVERRLTSVEVLCGEDHGLTAQILCTMSGPESFAKRNILNIMKHLEERSKVDPLIGADVLEYIGRIRRGEVGPTAPPSPPPPQQANKRPPPAAAEAPPNKEPRTSKPVDGVPLRQVQLGEILLTTQNAPRGSTVPRPGSNDTAAPGDAATQAAAATAEQHDSGADAKAAEDEEAAREKQAKRQQQKERRKQKAAEKKAAEKAAKEAQDKDAAAKEADRVAASVREKAVEKKAAEMLAKEAQDKDAEAKEADRVEASVREKAAGAAASRAPPPQPRDRSLSPSSAAMARLKANGAAAMAAMVAQRDVHNKRDAQEREADHAAQKQKEKERKAAQKSKKSTKQTSEEDLKQPDICEWSRQRAERIEEMKRKQRANPRCWRSREKKGESSSEQEEEAAAAPAAEAVAEAEAPAEQEQEAEQQEAQVEIPLVPTVQPTPEEVAACNSANSKLVRPYIAAFKKHTGFTRTKYLQDLAVRLIVDRPSDKCQAHDETRFLCGQVREWDFGDDDEKWLVVIGAACPQSATLPERNIIHWLKLVDAPSNKLFVLDIGYKGFPAEPAALEECRKYSFHQVSGFFIVSGWEPEAVE